MRADTVFIRVRASVVGSLVLVGAMLAGCGGESSEQIVASAQRYFDQGKNAEAVIELKRALERDPDSAQARTLLGRALLASSDPAGAEVELLRAREAKASDVQVLPSLARAMLLLGKAPKLIDSFGNSRLAEPAADADLRALIAAAYSQQGQLDKANETIAQALQADPRSTIAVVVQARMKARDGDVDGALRVLDSLLATDPGNAEAGTAKGYLLWLGRNDGSGALDAHRRVLAAHPDHVPAMAELVTIQFRQGKVQEARQAFERLRKAAPLHPETVFFEAQFAYVDGQYGRAREIVDDLLKFVPDHPRALELAAAAEYQLGHDVQAQAYAARAIKVNPGLMLARQVLARSQMRMGNASQALQVLAPLLEGSQADAQSLALAGEALLRMGDARRADDAFKRASALAPRDIRVRTRAALAQLQGGRGDVALRDLEALAAGDAGTQADLALISARIAAGDLRGALSAIEAAARKTPGQPLPDQLRGQVLVAQRDAVGARRSFEAALAKDARYFPAVAALASLDVVTGKAEDARRRVKAFLKETPAHGQALILLASIPAADGSPTPDAVEILAEGVRTNPREVSLQLALIQRHAQNGDHAAALNAAQAAASALPNDMAILQALGQTQFLAGQVQQAISTLRTMAAVQERNASVQMNLAEALLANRDRDGARAALKKALEIDPHLGEARRALAMLALQDNDVEQALAIARDMQKLPASSGLGHATEGDIQAGRQNWAAAAPAYRKALDASGASEAAIKLHTTLLAQGRSSDAQRLAAEWEARRPNDPAFQFHLGDLATNRNDLAAAEVHYRAVLASQPNNALAMNNTAWLLHKQGKPGALSMAERANAMLPNRAPILDTLAAIQAAAGEIGKAVETQRIAVRVEPRDPELKLRLARYLRDAGQRDEARQTLKILSDLGSSYPKQAEVLALLKSL